MKAVQLARARLQLLYCCCQIIAGSANMNFQLSDSALRAWLKGGIWSSAWQGLSSCSPGFQDPVVRKEMLYQSLTAMCHFCFALLLLHDFTFLTESQMMKCLNLIHVITVWWPPCFNSEQCDTRNFQIPDVLSWSCRAYFNFTVSFWSAWDHPLDWSKMKRSKAPHTDLVKRSHQCDENESAGAVIQRLCV